VGLSLKQRERADRFLEKRMEKLPNCPTADELLTAKMVELLDEMPKGRRGRNYTVVDSRAFVGWNKLQRAREYLRQTAAKEVQS
jgi:hypothetical protein